MKYSGEVKGEARGSSLSWSSKVMAVHGSGIVRMCNGPMVRIHVIHDPC